MRLSRCVYIQTIPYYMKLLFDFGGVLVDLDKERCLRAFRELGIDARPYLDSFVQAGVFSRFELGETDAAGFCRELRQVAGCGDVADGDILEAWRGFLLDVPVPRLETLLRARRNYPVYVLSNTNSVHWEMASGGYFRYKGLRLDDFFDGVFLSYELGLAKPDPEIFKTVARRIGGEPDDILFFDDSEENCAAARRCGLRTQHAPAGGGWVDMFDENGLFKGCG